MGRQTAKILVSLVLVSVLISLGACSSPPSEKAEQAKEIVKQETIAEKDLLYDNGENFLVVFTYDWAIALAVLQPWCRQHPNKRLSVSYNYSQNVFVVYYYEVKD